MTGGHADLGKALSQHLNVDAVWNFGDSQNTAMVEAGSAGNLKRTWAPLNSPAPKDYLMAATEVKNIWIPYGE